MVWLHEAWYTILYGIYCCFEVVKIKKIGHMFEITCGIVQTCIVLNETWNGLNRKK